MGNVRSGRVISDALRKKGFLRWSDGDHVRFCFLDSKGERTKIQTKISHGMGNSTVSADLISKMAKQLKLTTKQFLALIDCTLDETGYREILEKQGLAV